MEAGGVCRFVGPDCRNTYYPANQPCLFKLLRHNGGVKRRKRFLHPGSPLAIILRHRGFWTRGEASNSAARVCVHLKLNADAVSITHWHSEPTSQKRWWPDDLAYTA